MIGGLSGNYPVLIPVERAGDRRERAPGVGGAALEQASRGPAETGDARDAKVQNSRSSNDQELSASLRQRIEARAQAQAALLEKDDSPTLPRQSQQALQTYGDIASRRVDLDVELVGLDLRV